MPLHSEWVYETWPILNTSCKFSKEKLGVCIGEEAVGFRDTTSGALLWVPRPGEHRGGRDLHLQTINVMELCTIVYIYIYNAYLSLGNLEPEEGCCNCLGNYSPQTGKRYKSPKSTVIPLNFERPKGN